MTINQSRLCPSQLCEVYPLDRIGSTHLSSGFAFMHNGALADCHPQFHPNMDVTEKQRHISLAGGMSQSLIMQTLTEWRQGLSVLN
jgi:hypothetical protein